MTAACIHENTCYQALRLASALKDLVTLSKFKIQSSLGSMASKKISKSSPQLLKSSISPFEVPVPAALIKLQEPLQQTGNCLLSNVMIALSLAGWHLPPFSLIFVSSLRAENKQTR